MKVLIVKLSALGDVVQTLPSLSYLKHHLPSAEIEWVVDERNVEILEENPHLKKVWVVPKNFPLTLKKSMEFFKAIRKETYSLVIDYQGLFKSGIIVGIVRSLYKLGFRNHREGSWIFYNKKLPPYDPEIHAVRRYLLLTKYAVKLFRENTLEPYEYIFDLFLPEKFPDKINLDPFYVIFIPSARWKTKIWPFLYWEKLIKYFKNLNETIKIYIVGADFEKFLKSWAESMEKKYPQVRSLVGKLNLKELVYVIKRAIGVISVDTGPMHIASALKVPVIALFGPTSSKRTGPWGQKFRVIEKKTECSPCFRKNCDTLECMKKITPEEVWKNIREMLKI